MNAGEVAKRKVSLLLPLDHPASHRIDTRSGDVELEKLTAKVLRVASRSGSVAIMGAEAESIELSSRSGSVEIEDTKSKNPVFAKSRSGNVDVSNSEAPSWRLS